MQILMFIQEELYGDPVNSSKNVFQDGLNSKLPNIFQISLL